MQKKGLAILTGPYVLLQFLWYYSTFGRDVDWTAVLISYGRGKTASENARNMDALCRKSGVFSKIVIAAGNRMFDDSAGKKLRDFCEMLFFWATGNRVEHCKKQIASITGESDYSVCVVSCDSSLISSAAIALGKTCDVMILEDGLGDYRKKFARLQIDSQFCVLEIVGFLLAKMGYGNPANRYILKTTQSCIKYAALPQRMRYRAYREVRQLFDLTHTDRETYNCLIDRVFSPEAVPSDYADVVLVTSPFSYADCADECLESVKEFLQMNYAGKRILIKLHPRDTVDYSAWTGLSVVGVMDAITPFEVLLPSLQNCSYVIVLPSTIMISLDAYKCKYEVLYFSLLASRYERYVTSFNETIETLQVGEDAIVRL